MRRAARHFFMILAGMSLLLFVAVCALWVRGYFVMDEVAFMLRRQGPPRTVVQDGHEVENEGELIERGLGMTSSRGRVALGVGYTKEMQSDHPDGLSWNTTTPTSIAPQGIGLLNQLGFDFVHIRQEFGTGQ